MFEITGQTAAEYLQSAGPLPKGEPVDVRELAGGVSNVVLLVTLPQRGETFVLKQARERLRVKDDWRCPVERIWREMETLSICGRLLDVRNGESIEAIVPKVLWEDREHYIYAMTAAPEEHRTWKEMLLAGDVENSRDVALACGQMLGQLHGASWGNREIAAALDDRTYFDRLRLDPYYRQIARVHVDLAPAIERLIDSVWQNRCSLVHGDFSPKNLLVWPRHVMLIDFEVGHFGDPAFDLGFFLTHLLLKSLWAGHRRSEYLHIADRFWNSYALTIRPAIGASDRAGLEHRALWNLAGCMLARVDGKSRVEYLSAAQQDCVRQLSREWIVRPPKSWKDATEAIRRVEIKR
jgi:5-methylthioribose kinase